MAAKTRAFFICDADDALRGTESTGIGKSRYKTLKFAFYIS